MDDILLQIVYLKDFTDATWEEIGEQVGLSSEAARSRYRVYKDSTGDDGFKQVTPNHIILNGISPNRIITIEQLIEAHNLDLEEWVIHNPSLRKWDVASKHQLKNVQWEKEYDSKSNPKSIKTGDEQWTGKMIVTELYYVKVDLLRKNPEPIEPFIQHVKVELPSGISNPKTVPSDRIVMFLPCPQFGFREWKGELVPLHDYSALELALHVAKSLGIRLTDVIWGGDTIDGVDFTLRYPHEPELIGHMQKTFDDASSWIGLYRRELPGVNMKVLEGNHDKRLRDALVKLFPAAYGLKPGHLAHIEDIPASFSIPALLGLYPEKYGGLGVEYVPDYPNSDIWVGNVQYTHGTKFGRWGTAVSKILKESIHNVVTAHDHRLQIAWKSQWGKDGKEDIFAMIPGMMANPDGRLPAFSQKKDFQQGFGLVFYDGDKAIDAIPVRIDQGQAVVLGNIFKV